MCKKLCLLILSVSMLSLTSTSYSEVVIGNFENNMDSWGACDWGPPGNPTFSYSTTGATLDSYSLMAVQPTDGFNWFLINTNVNADDFRANNIISMDVTRLANEWTRGDPEEDHNCYLDARFQDNRNYNLVGLGNAGYWDSNDPDANDTMTFTWNYTTYKNQPDVLSPNATSIQIVIGTNGGGYTGNGIWYIDNIRLLTSRNEKPRNGAWGVGLDPTLKWDEASPADKFDVYVGTDFNDVNDASRADHPGLLFYSENQDPNNYPITGTTNGTTYYWRIDDVVGGTRTKGEVWHFTTYLLGSKITVIGDWEQQMDGWVASDPNDANMVLGYSTRGATLNNYSLSVDAPQDWYNAVRIPINETGFTHQLLANNRFSLDVTWNTTEFSGDIESIVIDGDEIQGLQLAPTSDTIIRSDGSLVTRTFKWDYTAIDFSTLPAEPNELTLSICTTAEARGRYYFDNARFYNSKVASDPRPGDTETDVQQEAHLVWTPGEGAETHDVYFGADYDQVNDASRSDQTGLLFYDEDRAYDANDVDVANVLGYPLTFDTTYYWRIDEANEIIWKGDVWSFKVGRYLVVDDFEDYNNSSPDKVYQTWIDGLGYTQPPPGVPGNGTGSTVGHDIVSPDSPYYQGNIIETSIVHGRGQSMPMDYNNVNDPYVSEAIRTWETPQDWTADEVAALTIWFRGYRQSVGGISYNAATQTYTMTGAGADIYGESDEFHYAYKQLSGPGSITAKVESLSDIHEYSKAGVMIRETLDADSAQVLVSVTPRQNGVEFMYRLAGETTTEWTEAGDPVHNPPHWVRIRRVQNNFYAEHSADNVIWVDVQGDEPSMANVPMSANTYIGLHVLSHEEFQTAEAVFSNVRTTGTVTPTGPFTQSQDIGISSNDADRLYVILEDDDDNSYRVDRPEPNATQIYEWQDWNIDMREFTNAGVNTAAITKMTIGVGNKAAPAAAGTGSMYFDDIRLYQPQCIPSELQPVGDLNDDCVVNYLDLDEMAGEWLSIPAPGAELVADLDDDGDVDFGDYAELASAWLEELIWPQL